MGFFDRFRSKKREEVAELMKSLCLDFVGDIYNNALPRAGIPGTSVDPIEPIILGMSLITIAYQLGQIAGRHGDSQKSREQLEIFDNKMEDFLVNEIYLKIIYPKIKTTAKEDNNTIINTWIATIKSVANLRFIEYHKTFAEEFKTRPMLSTTIEAFSKHFLEESVDEDKSISFVVGASLVFMFHLNRCLSALK